jgi:pimeloyl-ACP methyl ester carboxylesterase
MSPEITPDTFLTCTCTSTGSNPNPVQPPETTIFFISGNPGLIGYYHPFLSLLSKYLTPENENDNGNEPLSFQIYGCSLGGFELNDEKNPPSHERTIQKSQSDDWDLDLDLEDQIRFVQEKLTRLMRINPITTGSKQKVILIGHSVGAYIAMEILRRHREASSGEGRDFDIIGGAMLFPTVIDIAASASGRKLTVWFGLLLNGLALKLILGLCLDSIINNPSIRHRSRVLRETAHDAASGIYFAGFGAVCYE